MARSTTKGIVVACVGFVLTAWADDLPTFSLNGFGTLGAYRDNSQLVTFIPDTREQVTYGSTDKTRFDGDSQISVQGTVAKGDFQMVVQLLAKQNSSHDFPQVPSTEWAYLGWQPTEELNIKLGQTVAPVFLLSDSRNVFYSQTDVRPNDNVYNINPITNQNGGTLLWERNTAVGQFSVEGFFGKTGVKVASGTVNIDRDYGLGVKWNKDSWTFRAASSTFDRLSFSFSATSLGQIQQVQDLPFCANCSAILASDYGYVGSATVGGIKANLVTVGGMYDDGSLQALGEYAKRTANSDLLVDVKGYYLMLGYRFGNFTPFTSAGRYSILSPDPQFAALPQAQKFQPILDSLNSSFITGYAGRSSNNLGIRWDFRPKMDLKAQITRYNMDRPNARDSGQITYAPNSGFGGQLNVYTVTLDFIF